MRTFKICPPDGLWHGRYGDDGGNDTYFTTDVQNLTTLNRGCLSKDYYYPGSHLYGLDTIGYPILLALCTFGNVLSVIAFSTERPNTSKNIFLAAISVANFIYMWCQLPFYLHNAIPQVRSTDSFAIFFWRSEGIWKFLTDTFVTTSDWILVMFSLERLCAVCAPHQYSKRNEQGVVKASLAIFGVFVGAIFYSLYNLIGYYWFYYHHVNGTDWTEQLPSGLKIWRHMQQLAIVCVPIGTYALILLINALIILMVLVRRSDYPAPLHVSKTSNSGDLTRLVIASFVLYLVFVVAMFDLDIILLLNMFHLYDMNLQSRMYQIWYPIALYLLNVNYSVNFFIYLLVSPNFRRGLRRAFCCGRRKTRRNRAVTERTVTESTRTILAYPDRTLSESPGSDEIFLTNTYLKPSHNGMRI